MNLLALDPGLRNPAAAIFENGVLTAASRVRVPAKLHKLERGQRCLEVAKLIYEWVGEQNFENTHGEIDELVFEWPRTYRRMKGDPADLFPLAGVGMALAGMLLVPVTALTAAEWIGSLSKSTTGDPLTSPRGRRVWSRLSLQERERVVLSHDSLDAVGLGLAHVGRLERLLALHGATGQ